MNEEEILIKIIEKAAKNDKTGFCQGYLDRMKGNNQWMASIVVNMVCLSPEFAIAFWTSISCHHESGPCRHVYRDGNDCKGLPAWKWHLQQLVIAQNRISYLRKFIKE